jgi:nicotinate-nucleotide adenylyltransferase
MSHKKKYIGFLGGTFDPIHIGHLHVAFEAKERFSLDEILFCPTFVSPLKIKETPMATPEHRLKMVSLAIEGIEGFSLLDYEIVNGKVAYTIDTIKFLKAASPLCDYSLILGEDHLNDFFEWKQPEELLKLAPLKIASREGVLKKEFLKIPKQYHVLLQEGFFKIHNLEVSSTYLRERLASKSYCKHLIPPKVVDYIHRYGIYLTS